MPPGLIPEAFLWLELIAKPNAGWPGASISYLNKSQSLSRSICPGAFRGGARQWAERNRFLRDGQILNELKLTPTNVNLTQAADASALGEVLAHTAKSASSSTVPVIFFDEFDAPKNGAPYGWLAWFLAPMQDGKFLHNGEVITYDAPCMSLPGARPQRCGSSPPEPSADADRRGKPDPWLESFFDDIEHNSVNEMISVGDRDRMGVNCGRG